MDKPTWTQKISDLVHSVRFQHFAGIGFFAALATYQHTHSITDALFAGALACLGPSATVGTIDRNSDKKVEAANIAARGLLNAANPNIPAPVPPYMLGTDVPHGQ